MKHLIAKVVRSPVLVFLIFGAVIYAAYAAITDAGAPPESRTITVTSGYIEGIEQAFAMRWHRPPMPEELQGLVDQYVREIVLYREALAMGLDQDDQVIRRRLAQKLEFLFQDLADAIPPTEQDLRDHFAAHEERYREPDLLTVTQVFVDPDRRGDETLDDAAGMLAELKTFDDPTEGAVAVGDPFMLQSYYPERPQSELAKLFGREFARSLFELEPGQWHGPVLSGYGTHLVYVHGRTEFPPPAFERVRELVARDWQDAKREEILEQSIESLMSRYTVIIEDDGPVATASTE